MIHPTFHSLPITGEIFAPSKAQSFERVQGVEMPTNQAPQQALNAPEDVILRIKKLQAVILDAARLQAAREALKELEQQSQATYSSKHC